MSTATQLKVMSMEERLRAWKQQKEKLGALDQQRRAKCDKENKGPTFSKSNRRSSDIGVMKNRRNSSGKSRSSFGTSKRNSSGGEDTLRESKKGVRNSLGGGDDMSSKNGLTHTGSNVLKQKRGKSQRSSLFSLDKHAPPGASISSGGNSQLKEECDVNENIAQKEISVPSIPLSQHEAEMAMAGVTHAQEKQSLTSLLEETQLTLQETHKSLATQKEQFNALVMEMQAQVFTNALQSQQIEELECTISRDRLDNNEHEASKKKKFKKEKAKLEQEKMQVEERANDMVAQLTEQMNTIQTVAMSRIEELEKEMLMKNRIVEDLQMEISSLRLSSMQSQFYTTSSKTRNSSSMVDRDNCKGSGSDDSRRDSDASIGSTGTLEKEDYGNTPPRRRDSDRLNGSSGSSANTNSTSSTTASPTSTGSLTDDDEDGFGPLEEEEELVGIALTD